MDGMDELAKKSTFIDQLCQKHLQLAEEEARLNTETIRLAEVEKKLNDKEAALNDKEAAWNDKEAAWNDKETASERRIQELHKQIDDLKQIKEAFKVAEDEVVQLDVGGSLFKTRVSTLTQHSKYFRAVFSDGVADAQKEPLFIDRDPQCFGEILYFMRTGAISTRNKPRFLRAANYYQMDGLVEGINTEEIKSELLPDFGDNILNSIGCGYSLFKR
jgi:hypothetical protein